MGEECKVCKKVLTLRELLLLSTQGNDRDNSVAWEISLQTMGRQTNQTASTEKQALYHPNPLPKRRARLPAFYCCMNITEHEPGRVRG